MTEPYKIDRIDREKPDLMEGSSVKFVAVPLVLWISVVIFGISYLSLQTKDTLLDGGDKRSPVQASTPGGADDPQLGASLYKKHCQACHQPTGLGVGTAFPPLVDSEWVQGDPEVLSAIILHGISGEIEVKGVTFKGAMPTFKKKLSPPEIAAVATYVRSSWGNQADAVTAETVESVLAKTAERESPWKGGAELEEHPWK